VVLVSATRSPLIGPWIRGQFALHHVDPRMSLDGFVDAIHATIATAPADVLKKLNDQLIIAAVQVDPERARASWGLLPEHQITPSAEEKFAGNEQR
jgi:hypothetical protein